MVEAWEAAAAAAASTGEAAGEATGVLLEVILQAEAVAAEHQLRQKGQPRWNLARI